MPINDGWITPGVAPFQPYAAYVFTRAGDIGFHTIEGAHSWARRIACGDGPSLAPVTVYSEADNLVTVYRRNQAGQVERKVLPPDSKYRGRAVLVVAYPKDEPSVFIDWTGAEVVG